MIDRVGPTTSERGPTALPPMGQGLAVVATMIVVGIAMGVATGLYLLSLHTAARNARTAAVDQKIAIARRQIGQLRMELDFRSRFVELERWSGPLGLAPAAGLQYAPGTHAFADAARQVTLRTEQPVVPAIPCRGNACQGATATIDHGYTPRARSQMDGLVGGIVD